MVLGICVEIKNYNVSLCKDKTNSNMSMVFKFRMLSDESDAFVRDYEIMDNVSLLDFKNFICKDLKYDSNAAASFFTSNAEWEKKQEFAQVDMEFGIEEENEDVPSVPMESVTLGQIVSNNRDRLIYMFDVFGDRAYFLELIDIKEIEKGVGYPRGLFSHGQPADQFNADISASGASIFDEMMDDFNDFEGDESYDENY